MVTGKRRHGCVYSNVLNSIPKNTVKLDILNLSEIFLYRHSSVIQVWKGILLEKCIVTQFKKICVNLMISFGLSTFHCNSSLNIYIRLWHSVQKMRFILCERYCLCDLWVGGVLMKIHRSFIKSKAYIVSSCTITRPVDFYCITIWNYFIVIVSYISYI